MRWMNLEPIIQSDINQKQKDNYCILMHIYRIKMLLRIHWPSHSSRTMCSSCLVKLKKDDYQVEIYVFLEVYKKIIIIKSRNEKNVPVKGIGALELW